MEISFGVIFYVQKYRTTELAVILGVDYNDWQGTAISDLMSNTEKKNYDVSLINQ